MPKPKKKLYSVEVPEVWYQTRYVMAKSKREAIQIAQSGVGWNNESASGFTFSHLLPGGDVEEITATKFKQHGLCMEDVAALEVECS